MREPSALRAGASDVVCHARLVVEVWGRQPQRGAVSSEAKEADQRRHEVRRQVRESPGILTGDVDPDYESCIAISTDASLRKMIAPGLLVILSPLVAGAFFGYQCTNGILAGCIVSGIQIAFSASNSGGAWDNAKKYVEAGKLYIDQGNGLEQVLKGSPTHAAAVTGDTVGDPLKDTSGPSINILIKLSAICSLVFGTFLTQYGGLIAGGVETNEDAAAAGKDPVVA